jgi:hypothetical protein
VVDQEKLEAAVVAAIAVCGNGEDRFVRLLEYIDHLQGDKRWSNDEISGLRARVQRLISFPPGSHACGDPPE